MQPRATNRLFFALKPDEAVCLRISSAVDELCARQAPGGYRIKPERYHLTLYFLGDHVTADAEAQAREAARKIRTHPFELRLDQAGSFANREVPVWLGATHPPAGLKELERILRERLAGITVGRQPRFVPHLTILRSAKKVLPREPVPPIVWRVEDFVLIRSILHERPMRYEVLDRYPLLGDAPQAEPVQLSLLDNRQPFEKA
jgi:RNA 2',3'-cyclic 3'-phosphodiesterase